VGLSLQLSNFREYGDRRGQLFAGRIGTTAAGWVSTTLRDQWVDSRFRTRVIYGRDIGRFDPTGEEERIALTAPKTTDMLRARPICHEPTLLGRQPK
jgi:hypothetical protein